MDPEATVFGTVKGVAGDATELEVRTLLGGFGFPGDMIEKRVSILSGGEKIRLAFARLLLRPPNFLVLDEPTTHLDIQAREALQHALRDFAGTICLVSHDIDFVRGVAGGIVAMTPPGVKRYAGGYDYYHEKVTPQAGGGGRCEVEGGSKGRKSQERESPREPVSTSAQAGSGSPLPASPHHPPPSTSAGGTAAQLDRKALRQQRAQDRQALYDRTKDLKKAIARTEAEVERLEKEKADLTLQLSSPAEGTDFAALNRRLQQLQYEIDIATAKWEQATAALEQALGGAGEAEE
jgi:ATP-binding cassette subfamily F protein 3